jgi:hypothetical protein
LIEINRKNPGLFDGKAKPDDPPADQQAAESNARARQPPVSRSHLWAN